MSSTKETKEPLNMDEHQEEMLESSETGSEANEAVSEHGDQPSAEPIDESNAAIAELQRLADDNHSRYLRAQADFDNFRRRTLKEKEELAQYASLKLITQLLPVMDNFERALQTGGEVAENGSFSKGVDMIYRQLFQVLEAEGLKPMDAVGQPFDPELHQAVMQVESDEYDEGIVVEAIQTGYLLKDKVIRPAMVKVSG
ncbi:nucleotide exchange factor GrpE [Cohnella endophytica]|uniref:Protein GrpE n=1 Tax=Cohnella endophytica TaxID=2419778 RepID=A0A494XX99_9BACL|nr:nucleotide exchange factor GrpE [Cohnella endophytica]RKP55195.1 nucleotide exchange factor GrpE [Cohnella endophytica]